MTVVGCNVEKWSAAPIMQHLLHTLTLVDNKDCQVELGCQSVQLGQVLAQALLAISQLSATLQARWYRMLIT